MWGGWRLWGAAAPLELDRSLDGSEPLAGDVVISIPRSGFCRLSTSILLLHKCVSELPNGAVEPLGDEPLFGLYYASSKRLVPGL